MNGVMLNSATIYFSQKVRSLKQPHNGCYTHSGTHTLDDSMRLPTGDGGVFIRR